LTRHDLSPWYPAYQKAPRWITTGVFEDIVHDLRASLRLAKGKNKQPDTAIFDGWTVHSTLESGERTAYKRNKGSKIYLTVYMLGLLLAAHVTPANK
jgi:hypothetical protein